METNINVPCGTSVRGRRNTSRPCNDDDDDGDDDNDGTKQSKKV